MILSYIERCLAGIYSYGTLMIFNSTQLGDDTISVCNINNYYSLVHLHVQFSFNFYAVSIHFFFKNIYNL